MCRNNHGHRENCLCEGEEGFQRLIERVEKLNPEAAEWLRSEECREVMQLHNIINHRHGVPCGDLDKVLIWNRTPQRSNYWCRLYVSLREEYRHVPK